MSTLDDVEAAFENFKRVLAEFNQAFAQYGEPLPEYLSDQRITVDKNVYEVVFENETEKSVDVLIRPKQ